VSGERASRIIASEFSFSHMLPIYGVYRVEVPTIGVSLGVLESFERRCDFGSSWLNFRYTNTL
jgi:hypothetical protein